MREIVFIDDGQPARLKAALDLVRDVFWEFEAMTYSNEGVSEFCDYIEYDAIAAMLESGEMVMLGCYDNQKLAGVLALRVPAHISLLFVAKPWHRRGVAKTLLAATAYSVQQLTEAKHVTVNSSPYAVPIYAKMGFTPAGREKTVNGIRFMPMELALYNEASPENDEDVPEGEE